MAGSDLVHPMWFSAWIGLRAVDLVADPRDRSSSNIVAGRAADDGSAVIGFISDCNDL